MTTYHSNNAKPLRPAVLLTGGAATPAGDGADAEQWFGDTAPTVVATAPIAATIRCCVPPSVEAPHDALCPVYGYPPPVTRDADRVTCEHWQVCADCAPAATTSWAAEGLAAAMADPTDPEPTRSMMQAHAVAAWATAADERTTVTPDGLIWCRGVYMSDAYGCEHPQQSRFQLHIEGGAADVFRQLVIWAGLHSGCDGDE